MVQKLEAIRGGGGSVKVGTTGTISALMTRELESIKSASQTSVSHQDKPKTVAVSVPCSVSTTRRLPVRKSLNEASSSSNHRSTEAAQKMKNYNRSAHRMPMLSSENASIERTPIREKTKKKGTNIVEIVDIKCGHPDKAWASPITSKLKKLGFSKLSESII
ncbi:uncharacterized protein LOC110610281 [Manihot esculenta]|uniref:Uncharacterized protein n=1 Tax=Manihot esculenta TaxID=3983 RepID=A0A251LA29_MANES|nr:uncharacterized protein LOC110610281 [Manihot esculenta]XP_043810437.1 uncharacterized protein LOC110610281 [Manihot esculenta]OAY55084.1 hypothetical protein MANES_03G126700v8 [Manihot esculenta]